MEKMKKSLAAKVAAYILIIVCMVMAGLSAVVVAVNANYQWYSDGKKAAMQNIYEHTAYEAGEIIDESINSNWEWIIDGGKKLNDMEFFAQENKTEALGYSISIINAEEYGLLEEGALKEVNPELKNAEGTYISAETHHGSQAAIQVYLGENITSDNVPPEVYSTYNIMMTMYELGKPAIAVGTISLIIALCLIIFLVASVGRNESDKDYSVIDRMPIEIITAALLIPAIFTLMVGPSVTAGLSESYDFLAVMVTFYIAFCMAAGVGMILVLALKIKHRNLWKTSLLYKVILLIKWILSKAADFFRTVPLVWKAALILAAGIMLNLFIMIGSYMEPYYGAWFIGAIVVFVAGIYFAAALKKLKDGGKHLADGDLDYQIDKKKMFWDLAEHADNLNSIRNSISKAVEERMKSEHFRSELITNVSHDIKTPLTSIINYVDFLKKEDIDNEKAKEYIEVLDRQSKRLKKLTEDLVEASKAATGNIKLDMQPCQVGVMMQQVMGEYKEKTEAEELKMITVLPEKQLEIMADGRSLWRVFDNLLNNICKYSQPGTRVYQTLEERDGKAIIIYRNMSKYELNITEEELMERFVRGDSSRHTEGSGLGLSIARNLVEMQGGKFNIVIDGDLFKVIIKFDLMR